ncbi:hypothetical protein KAR10_08750 [bacterium]|nr:hypothetical protein [bacterium]
MNCQVCRKFLPLFIDFPLPFRKHSQIEKHLKGCQECQKEFKALSHTINLVQQVPDSHMPEDFLPRLRARLKNERSPRLEWRLWNPWAWGTIATAAMILLTLVLYPSLQNNKLTPIRRIAQAPPVAVTKVKSPGAILTNYTAPTLWAESDAPLLKQYKRNINSVFNQTIPRPVSLPTSEKSHLYQAVGYATGSDDLFRRSNKNPPVPEPNSIFRQKGEWTGERCRITSPRNFMLRDSEKLKALWREAGINSISMPEVDWTKHMLGAIFLGKQPGREYEIHLNEIQKSWDKLVVKYRVIAPLENSTGETTCPFLLFTLPVSSLPVEFLIEN